MEVRFHPFGKKKNWDIKEMRERKMEIMEKGFVRYPIRMTFSTLSAVEKKGGGNDRTPVQSKRS